ncbi:circadian clock protein KaiC [Halomonas vilamensis]|uniref:non-specific serine/threonine protein kinase n=1 Tax=Vreelandella vilamensis TaxID=531309 RepID=A0ABU1H7Q7_9GAMM|nr:circadian clock protein KaiC [Halomonas vilamensis]MDR5900335.1 circadian clock protein KaiC [Halomonas vilamensis]
MVTKQDTESGKIGLPDSRDDTATPRIDSPVAATGIEGFDFIMRGGLPAGHPTLLRGGPGTGKTVISLSFLCHGLDIGEPGVLATFDESPQALIQHADVLGLNLGAHIEAGRARILDMRPDREEMTSGETLELSAILARIEHAIEQIGARRLVIDAIDGLEGAFIGAEKSLQFELRRVFDWIRKRQTTTVINIGEHGDFNRRYGIEDYIADCVIALKQEVTERVMIRLLRVVKRRGGGHGTNEFPYLIDREGIFVMPLTATRVHTSSTNERLSTGIRGLDGMLGGEGIYRGVTAMYSGQSGTGKTTFAASFACAACQRGEDVLYLSFEEGDEELMRNQRSVGIDLKPHLDTPQGRGRLVLEPMLAAETGWEEHLLRILRAVRQHQPAIVILDPLSALSHKLVGANSTAMVLRLLSLLRVEGVTTVATELLTDSSGGESTLGISSAIDMWIKLRREERDYKLRRLLTVVKSRGMTTADYVNEYTLSDQGVVMHGRPGTQEAEPS